MSFKTIYRERSIIVDIITHYTCNVCGKKEETVKVKDTYYSPHGWNVIRLSGGYGDTYPKDGETFEASLCCECTKKWADTFLIPPDILGESPIVTAYHTETKEAYSVGRGVCWKGDYEEKVWFDYCKGWEEELAELHNAVWEHKDGGRYRTIDLVLDSKLNRYVFYQALYGDSLLYVRPISVWGNWTSRFTKVSN